MILGKVVGTIVSTQKDPGMEGYKILVVQQVDFDMNLTSSYVIAVDSVGAGINEYVLTVGGSSARITQFTKDKPVDCTIVAIVDSVEIHNKIVYRKQCE